MPYIASMGIYVISKHVMLQLLRDQFPGANDFGSEVIHGATELRMRVSYDREEWTSCYPYCLRSLL
jgi:glucose-1-phosphate adenylyltransferase